MSPSPKIPRREMLQFIAATTLVPACGGATRFSDSLLPSTVNPPENVTSTPEPPPTTPEPPPEPPLNPDSLAQSPYFPIGLSSGDPGSNVIQLASLWEGMGELCLYVWKEDGSQVVRQPVTRGDAGYISIEVSNLEPWTQYRWALVETENATPKARSAVAEFRTAPAPGESPTLRFAAVACTSNRFRKVSLERAAERGPFDAFLLLGDASYNDGSNSVEQFRDKWRESLSSDGWKAMRRIAPVIATWDDHEFDNNFNPERADAGFIARAKQTFYEVMPTRRTASDRLWRKVSFGDTADVFVLDTRSERKPSTRRGTDPIYISKEQMSWLKSELKASRARFKILMNSVPIGDFPVLFDVSSEDRWEGYAKQREEILNFISTEAISGILWVSGDFHLASVGRVARSGPGADQTEILFGPGAQIGNGMSILLQAPQFTWASSESNTTILELDPDAGTIRCTWLGSERPLREEILQL